MQSIDTSRLVGVRDRALSVLVYTAARAGAAASLRCGDFYDAGDQWMLHFREKGGKSRQIPVRHDLQQILFAYLDAAGLRNAPKEAPLFRSALRRTGQLTDRPVSANDVCRLMKRRLKDAGLSVRLSPHSSGDHHHRFARTGRSARICSAPSRSLRPENDATL